MVDISDLRVCKECRTVYSAGIGGQVSVPSKCPNCKSTSNEKVGISQL